MKRSKAEDHSGQAPRASVDAPKADVYLSGGCTLRAVNACALTLHLLRQQQTPPLMSGYTDDDVGRRGVHGETAFLQKPFTPRKARAVLDRAIVGSVA